MQKMQSKRFTADLIRKFLFQQWLGVVPALLKKTNCHKLKTSGS